tara:strand:+ start:638 stop:787 length:150 start_codon:yes stop_codon:yes gene_type:complete
MLLIIIAWILIKASAPWWIWTAFILHIVFSILVFLSDENNLIKITNKLK